MAHRVNVMIDDEIWLQLKAVPAGERSRLINEAVSMRLLTQRRMRAAERMDRLRQTGKRAKRSAEQQVRLDRNRRK
jgi:hypothetical protein